MTVKTFIFFSTSAIVAGLVAGCGGGAAAGPDAAAAETGEAELGTGTVAFEPIVPGQDLGLVAGTQGGHHFLAHARMMGLDPGDPESPDTAGNPRTSFEAFSESGARIDLREPARDLAYRESEDGWFALPSARILLISNDVVPAIYGTTVRIRLRIEDAAGGVATDEVEVRVVPFEDPGT